MNLKFAAVSTGAECSRWAAGSRGRSDAEASSDGRRQRQERFRRLLVLVARLPTDDDARQPAPVLPVDQLVSFCYHLIMVALCNRADHYIFALLFLSSIFFYSSPNLSGRRLDVYHTLTHGVALVRI